MCPGRAVSPVAAVPALAARRAGSLALARRARWPCHTQMCLTTSPIRCAGPRPIMLDALALVSADAAPVTRQPHLGRARRPGRRGRRRRCVRLDLSGHRWRAGPGRDRAAEGARVRRGILRHAAGRAGRGAGQPRLHRPRAAARAGRLGRRSDDRDWRGRGRGGVGSRRPAGARACLHSGLRRTWHATVRGADRRRAAPVTAGRRGRRPGRAALHLGHGRRAQGRHALPPRAARQPEPGGGGRPADRQPRTTWCCWRCRCFTPSG